MQPSRRPVVLCVLDGWGYREDPADNAVAAARAPVFQRLMAACPHALLTTCGIDVGLPAGQMGNSEVGHLNLGAGRIVNQEIRRIDAAIEDGSLAANPALARFVAALKASGGRCHLMGLLSPGGVHSMQDHMAALARMLDRQGIEVIVHGFLDGRDMPPQSAPECIAAFDRGLSGLARVRYGTISGRYYAMDRDKRWDRVAKAHAVLTDGTGQHAATPQACIEASYAAGVHDEFVLPCAIGGYDGMRDGDGLLMANFRADRAREILAALLDPGFDGFARPRTVRLAAALGMVEYSEALNPFLDALFHPVALDHILGEVVSGAGLRQFRIAETEKYPHVTYFFNGGIETPFPGEDRLLIPSPKVATYDLQPEMSAAEVTDRLVEAVRSGKYDFILVNYANPDMVGHTGFLAAAVKAIETVDACLGRLAAAVEQAGGALVVTADHGNSEMMRDPETGGPHTAHTLNPVPVILFNGPADVHALHDGRLADVAPTILDLLGLPQPAAMTGHSLLPAAAVATARRARAGA
ncbi:MAG: 2,3-bisphosphoglycerate-independent phosphoglycerate mutase [Rhodospirillales bacterium]